MMTEPANRRVLGRRISEALRTPAPAPSPAKHSFDPLIPLDDTERSGIPLLCVPGAGASVTSFNELVGAFGRRWPIYGLQPRGIDSTEQPHSTVEAAALCNLQAASGLTAAGPVHLLGHSHGGLVAYEMACRLQAQGRPVASLTIIDSGPPETSAGIIRDVTETEIFGKFVDAIRLSFERPLPLDHDVLAAGQAEAQLRHLHGAMIHAGILPARSAPEMLRGPLSAFAAALRSAYHPVAPYAGQLRLVQVGDPKLDAIADRQQQRHAEEWRRWAAEMEMWHGPGHHYSILRAPHVRALAEWWLSTGA
jgi:thioesterase domain-containing protein